MMKVKYNKSNFSKSTLFTRDYIVSVPNLEVHLRALTYREINNLNNLYVNRVNYLKTQIVKLSLKDIQQFELLTFEDIEELYDFIMDMSFITNKEYETVITSINILKDEATTFKDDTYQDCKVCQERKLDKHRNCPLLPEDTHSSQVFFIVGDKKIDKCPMDDLNNNPLVTDSIKAYEIFSNGSLPMIGGFIDQTHYFFLLAPIITSLLKPPSLQM